MCDKARVIWGGGSPGLHVHGNVYPLGQPPSWPSHSSSFAELGCALFSCMALSIDHQGTTWNFLLYVHLFPGSFVGWVLAEGLACVPPHPPHSFMESSFVLSHRELFGELQKYRHTPSFPVDLTHHIEQVNPISLSVSLIFNRKVIASLTVSIRVNYPDTLTLAPVSETKISGEYSHALDLWSLQGGS